MMNRLILVKTFSPVDMAHLYEHLFYGKVSELFTNTGLYQYVDYSLVGKTLQPGIVVIDIELYTADAIELSKTIPNIQIDVNEDAVFSAITQLMAEEERLPSNSNFSALKKELKKLDSIKWTKIDRLALIQPAHLVSRNTKQIFSISNGKPQKSTDLTFAITLDLKVLKEENNLLPLFYELSRILIDNLNATLPYTLGCYSIGDEFKKTSTNISLINTFKVANTKSINITYDDILESAQNLVKDLKKLKVFERHLSSLQKLSYIDAPNLTPNFEDVYNSTGILIGSSGWKYIATIENFKLILNNIHYDVNFS